MPVCIANETPAPTRLLLTLSLLLLLTCSLRAQDLTGTTAAAFDLTDINGNRIVSAETAGKVVDKQIAKALAK